MDKLTEQEAQQAFIRKCQELTQLQQRVRATRAELYDFFLLFLEEYQGLVINKTVIQQIRTKELYLLSQISDHNMENIIKGAGKPWIQGKKKNKGGGWSKREVGLYGDWIIYQEDAES